MIPHPLGRCTCHKSCLCDCHAGLHDRPQDAGTDRSREVTALCALLAREIDYYELKVVPSDQIRALVAELELEPKQEDQ